MSARSTTEEREVFVPMAAGWRTEQQRIQGRYCFGFVLSGTKSLCFVLCAARSTKLAALVYTVYTLYIQCIYCIYSVCTVYTASTLYIQCIQCRCSVYTVYTVYTLYIQCVKISLYEGSDWPVTPSIKEIFIGGSGAPLGCLAVSWERCAGPFHVLGFEGAFRISQGKEKAARFTSTNETNRCQHKNHNGGPYFVLPNKKKALPPKPRAF